MAKNNIIFDGLYQPIPLRQQGYQEMPTAVREKSTMQEPAGSAGNTAFTDLSKSGGGPVIDIGVHVIDPLHFMFTLVSVTATTYDKITDYKTKGVSRWEALDTDNPV